MENKIDLTDIYVKKILGINNIYHRERGKSSNRQNRPCYSLAYKTEGETVYRAQGKEYRSDPDTVLLISKGSSYKWTVEELGKAIMIEFDAELENDDFDILSFALNEKTEQKVSKLFVLISEQWMNKKSGYVLKCKSIIYDLLAELSIPTSYEYLPKYKFNRLKPALEYMNQNLDNKDITNAMLASMCGISEIYFRKMFEKCYKISPIKYLINQRIKKAKELLVSDFYSVGQVAEMTGFSNIYTFSKSFKNTVGISPTQYWKKTDKHI